MSGHALDETTTVAYTAALSPAAPDSRAEGNADNLCLNVVHRLRHRQVCAQRWLAVGEETIPGRWLCVLTNLAKPVTAKPVYSAPPFPPPSKTSFSPNQTM